MAVHKLQIDDFVTIDYELFAIHSSLEDYRLAYFINQNLRLLLEKCPKDVSVKAREGEGCFSRYFYEDQETGAIYNLIKNRSSKAVAQQSAAPLFADTLPEMATGIYLLPELKKVDYILKVENTPSFFAPSVLTAVLLDIKHITTAYTIGHDKLKSKNNLIF
jgi:hypothetical protein